MLTSRSVWYLGDIFFFVCCPNRWILFVDRAKE